MLAVIYPNLWLGRVVVLSRRRIKSRSGLRRLPASLNGCVADASGPRHCIRFDTSAADFKPHKQFVVYAGTERFSLGQKMLEHGKRIESIFN